METGKSQEKTNKFIVVKTMKKAGCQYEMKRMSRHALSETTFTNYWDAEEYSNKHENCHVILEKDFQHWLTPIELAARTASASMEAEKCII